MKNLKFHLWFAINFSILASYFYNPKLFVTPLWLVLFFSRFIIDKNRMVKSLFADVSKKWLLIPIGIVFFVLFSMNSGIDEKAADYLFHNPIWIRIFVVQLLVFVVIIYIKRINKCHSDE